MKTEKKLSYTQIFQILSIILLIISGIFVIPLAFTSISNIENEGIRIFSFFPYLGMFIGIFGIVYFGEEKDQLWRKNELEITELHCSRKYARTINYIKEQKNILKGSLKILENTSYAIVISNDLWIILSKDKYGNLKVILPTQFFFHKKYMGIDHVSYANYRFIEKIFPKDLERQVL